MNKDNNESITISFQVPYNSYRTTKEDYTYFGSDLNKFINKECPKIMTHINIDGATHKISKKVIRISEYKHEKEELGDKQEILLKELGKAFDFLNKHNYPVKFEIHLQRGNYPYNELIITDFITNATYKISGLDNVIKYLTIE